MVKLTHTLRNITTGRQLYKHLIKECQRLPSGASEHYKHSIKQSFKQHVDETNPERIKEIIERALEDAKWILDKYTANKKA
ncbi:hypothetical protein RUM43_005602 [Polyplax serrata]|uniref:LYR motif-containing protein 9 n=1 Tax=Polyplax serrata TaxID=468196 RepID=A0AAN8NRI2_POLSC